jgi:hypothetical protein
VFDRVASNVHVLGLTGRVPTLICNRATRKGLQSSSSASGSGITQGNRSPEGSQAGAVHPNGAAGMAVNMLLVMMMASVGVVVGMVL